MSPESRWQRYAERAVLAGLAALFAAMAATAWGYGLSDRLGPGSGFFPFWLGAIGAALCVGLFAISMRGHAIGEGAEAAWPDRAGAMRALALLGGLVVAAFALDPLGYRLTALVFCTGLLLALGVRRPVLIAVFALVSSFGVFHVFYYWLKVPLPIGALGF